MTRADLPALALVLIVSGFSALAGALIGAGEPLPPIRQPSYVTPIARVPTAEPTPTQVAFVPVATPSVPLSDWHRATLMRHYRAEPPRYSQMGT